MSRAIAKSQHTIAIVCGNRLRLRMARRYRTPHVLAYEPLQNDGVENYMFSEYAMYISNNVKITGRFLESIKTQHSTVLERGSPRNTDTSDD